jgi:hypothetical protein
MIRMTSPEWFEICPEDMREVIINELKKQTTELVVNYYMYNSLKKFLFAQWIYTIVNPHYSIKGYIFWKKVIQFYNSNNGTVPDVKDIVAIGKFKKVDILKHLENGGQ